MAAPWHSEQIHVAVGLKQAQLCHPRALEGGTKGKYLPLKTIFSAPSFSAGVKRHLKAEPKNTASCCLFLRFVG